MATVLVTRLTEDDIGVLLFTSGVLMGVGAGEQAQLLQRLISDAREVDVEEGLWPEESAAEMLITGYEVEPDDEFEEITVENDPTAPENLGIVLEHPGTPTIDETPRDPADVPQIGAGPPPEGIEKGR